MTRQGTRHAHLYARNTRLARLQTRITQANALERRTKASLAIIDMGKHSPVTATSHPEDVERTASKTNGDGPAKNETKTLQNIGSSRITGVLHAIAALDRSGVALSA